MPAVQHLKSKAVVYVDYGGANIFKLMQQVVPSGKVTDKSLLNGFFQGGSFLFSTAWLQFAHLVMPSGLDPNEKDVPKSFLFCRTYWPRIAE